MQNDYKSIEFLLVEDDPNDAELFVRALKKITNINNLLVLEDGVEALDFLFKRPETSKLKAIFLDLKLPRLNGLEVLKEIKTDITMFKIPIIIFTSSKEVIDIETAYKLGANSYIVKPTDYENFTNTILSIVNYWLKMNETIC